MAIRKCWCGTRNPYFATVRDGLDRSCDGTGTLYCLCGGDQCVCHWHGEVECDGCDDCDERLDLYEDEEVSRAE